MRKAGETSVPIAKDASRLQHQGHISRDCTAPNGGPLNSAGKVCYKCGQAGHISRDCTTTETNGQPAAETTPAPAVAVAEEADSTSSVPAVAATATVA
jgi:cellular nucleic acid-binding protein